MDNNDRHNSNNNRHNNNDKNMISITSMRNSSNNQHAQAEIRRAPASWEAPRAGVARGLATRIEQASCGFKGEGWGC